MNKTKIIFRWALGSVALPWKFKRAGSFPPNWKILVLIITLWIAGIHDVDFGSIALPWEFKRAGCFPPILVLIIILRVAGIHFIDIFGRQSFSRFCLTDFLGKYDICIFSLRPCCYFWNYRFCAKPDIPLLLFVCHKHIISTFFFFNYLVILVIRTPGVPFRN